jgi:hypothetical protein
LCIHNRADILSAAHIRLNTAFSFIFDPANGIRTSYQPCTAHAGIEAGRRAAGNQDEHPVHRIASRGNLPLARMTVLSMSFFPPNSC